MRPITFPTLFALLLAATPAAAQVNAADMRSGFVTFTNVVGLISTPLFNVPTGYRFVLTDASVARVSPTAPTLVGGQEMVRLTINVAGTTPTARWVATDRMTASDPPLHIHWDTGLVFEQNTGVEAAVSVLGGPTPFVTVCWSGYVTPTTTTSVIPGPPSSGDLALKAWPNPARQSTELSFNLGKSQRVLVGVFAVDGRRVRLLRNGLLPAGEQHVTWDGRDDAGRLVANGVYFAGLETAGGHATRRIARLR